MMLRRALSALGMALAANARVIMSVEVGRETTRASVIDGLSGRALASTAAPSSGDCWDSLKDACSAALGEADLGLSNVSCIEFHSHYTPMRPKLLRSGRSIIVEPSVLAADIGALSAAAREVAAAGATWVHVDITDGSHEAGRSLSSLGPASIAAVRSAAPSLLIDVHLYTQDPESHIAAVAAAGADRITFQMEMLGKNLSSESVLAVAQQRAKALAASIVATGCKAGVCIAPATPHYAVEPLCRDGDVDLVDVLSVNPGIGGQPFQFDALEKVRALRQAHPDLPYLLVDGGIDDSTAQLAAAAGANALVSGSYLFSAPPGGFAARFETLEHALVEHGE